MAKFCTWCGAPLEPGARFCGECGGRILETVTVDGSKAVEASDALRGFGIVDGKELPADATLRLDRDSVVVPTDNEQKRFSLDSAKKRRNVAFIVIGIIIAVLLVVVVVLGTMYLNGKQSGSSEPLQVASTDQSSGENTEQVPQPSSTSESEQATIDDKVSSELTEGQAYDFLSEAYEKLDTYDERIGTCVEDFNADFLVSSMDTRNASKEFADKVLSDLTSDLASLESAKIPSGSSYVEQAEKVMELYECQIGRVSALTNAWALDVTFETPSEHKAEILAKYTEGDAKTYLSRYDELYSQAEPTQAS